MFIAHYGAAFALKRFDSKISLGWLMLWAQLPDILWSCFILAGIEIVKISPGITKANPLEFVHYPYSHSLLATLGFVFLIFILVRIFPFKANLGKLQLSLLFVAAVVSHFVLDLISHRPDLPLAGSDSLKIGLSLWNNTIISYLFEFIIFFTGIYLYYQFKSNLTKARKICLLIFILLFSFLNLGNLLGPLPPDVETVAISGLGGNIIVVIFSFWLDR